MQINEQTYSGESNSKRVLRLHQYEQAAALWVATGHAYGEIVTLAGPAACELGCIKHILRLNPLDVHLVDVDTRGLARARRRWSGVRTHKMDMNKFLLSTESTFSLINLDFNGTLSSEDIQTSLMLGWRRLAPYGVLYYTFFRGREKQHFIEWLGARESDRWIDDSKRFKIDDSKRFKWYQERISEHFFKNEDQLVFSARYDSYRPGNNSKKCPMGVLGFQKIPNDCVNENLLDIIHRRLDMKINGAKTDHLCAAAIRLRRRGLDSQQIGEALNISPRKVAAWLAHETRGTYDNEPTTKNKRGK